MQEATFRRYYRLTPTGSNLLAAEAARLQANRGFRPFRHACGTGARRVGLVRFAGSLAGWMMGYGP
jgi:hypothetical protein